MFEVLRKHMYLDVREKVKNSTFSKDLYCARKKALFEIFSLSDVKMFSSVF